MPVIIEITENETTVWKTQDGHMTLSLGDITWRQMPLYIAPQANFSAVPLTRLKPDPVHDS